MSNINKTKILNDDEIRAIFKSISDREYDKMLNSERGKQILAEADNYGIYYNTLNRGIDWDYLIEKIESYQQIEECKRGAREMHDSKYGENYSYGY